MPNEYEDKYLLLRDENTALKKKKNEQEATIKRMYTKLAMIEEKLNKKSQNQANSNQDDPETGGNKAGVVPIRRDIDTEKFVVALKSENVVLRKKNQSLIEKNRWLEEQCRRVSSWKRHGNAAAPTARSGMQKKAAAQNAHASSRGFAGNTIEKQAESARKLHRDTFSGDLETALKQRLVVAEKHVTKLQKENERLRASSTRIQLKPRQDNNEDHEPIEDDEDEEGKSLNSKNHVNLEADQMKRELRDRQAQLAILNARYENLESNALAERDIQEKTLDQMEQMNRQVHKLRTQLQDAIVEKEELEIRIAKAGDQEKEITILREQNRRLEDRMTSLCESPFINDAFQRKERIDKLFELEKLTQDQKGAIARMTEENQRLQSVIRELQSSIKQLKQAKGRALQDLEQMTQHLIEERNAKSFEAIKSTVTSLSRPIPEPVVTVRARTPPEKKDACSSPVHNNLSPRKEPLTVDGGKTRRNYGNLPMASNFLDATEEDNSVKHLRNRVHVLRLAHLKSMQELERCEKMLQAQTNINRELAFEIEELTTSKITSLNQLQRRMQELELLCEERQQRINILQAEIRQLKYAREKMLLKAEEDGDACSEDCASDDDESEVASLSESLILASRDLAPGEQLLEFGIINGNFDSSMVGINSSTFVLCDFYDFESQSTPLVMGSRPCYNLSATFKVTVDGFFLRYLASECIVLEVHQAIRGDFKLIGKATIRLAKLLLSKGVIKEPLLAVKAVGCNSDSTVPVVGTLNIVLRLSTPISEIWQVHLRSYPQDLQLLPSTEKQSNGEIPTDVISDEDFGESASQFTNELQVTVFACRNLRSYSGNSVTRTPSSYAHYQLLGFPDVFTNIVPDSSNPEYDLSCSRQAFTLEVDACLLRFLSKCRFWITVFDDQAELDDNAQEDGVIGRCGLALAELVNGENIRGWFSLKGENEQHAGDISVMIQWKDPFQVLQLVSSQRARGINGRPIDMHSLDFDQQHALLSMFSSEMDGRVNYRQFLHYANPSEELELLVSKIKERFEYAIDSELVTSVQDALTAGIDVKQRKRMLIPLDAMVKTGEKHGIFLSDAEQALILTTFGTVDIGEESKLPLGEMARPSEKYIALNYLLLHVNPRLSCAERLLCHKIRQTVRAYVREQRKRKPANTLPAPTLFEKFDETKCGRINRSAFRKCLSALGFELMNVESEYRELVQKHTKQPVVDDPPSEANPTLSPRSGIDLDEEIVYDVIANSRKPANHLMYHSPEIAQKTKTPVKKPETSAPRITELNASSIPAASEFQRRKQAFMDRVKAIASAGNKNLVYEEVEKKLHGQRMQAVVEREKTVVSRQEVLLQQAKQLHTPQIIHHHAARTLQRQYRQYKEQQQENLQYKATAILEADRDLQSIMKNWSASGLSDLEDAILREIERDVPEANDTNLISKKQLIYSLSKVSSIALPSAVLWQLMDYFSEKKNRMVAYRPLLHFISSTSTEESRRKIEQRLSVLDRFLISVGHAYQTFVSAGDMNESGTISFRKFRECLVRLGVNLSTRDLHLVTILFDTNGFEVLYHALLHCLTQLPHYQKLAEVLGRCRRFGISLLRDKFLTFVNSDDGRMEKQELLRVLMQQNLDSERFQSGDADLLFRMIAGTGDSTKRISIHDLCLRLETAAKYHRELPANEYNKYDMHRLQRLTWNCRKLICGSFSDLIREFERFDWQGRELVSLVEFITIARQSGFILFTESQLKGMAKTFSAKTNGSFRINYRQFLDWTTPPPPVDMDNVEEKLRSFAQAQADKLPSRQLSAILASWNQVFLSEAESACEGVISRSHLVKICRNRLGVSLDESEMQALLYTYDPKLIDQIDCAAFLRMDWRETAIVNKHQNDVARKAVKKLEKELCEQKEKEIAEAFSYFSKTDDQLVDFESFRLSMRNLEIVMSNDEVEAIFATFGQQPEKRKLNFVKFFRESFEITLPVVSCTLDEERDCKSSPNHDEQMKSALKAAVKYALPKFQQCFEQFQEFCVLHNFANVPPSELWRQMEKNGLAELLSERCVRLLSKKFSTTSYDDDSSVSSVSLEAVHAYLQTFLQDVTDVLRKQKPSTQLKAPAVQLKPLRTPIAILSDFLDWCDERGVDLRGELEASDNTYTGFVTAMELKETLLHLGIAATTSPSSAEAVIGQLVRQFRSTDKTDAVHYVVMLFEATKSMWTNSDTRWNGLIAEHLRSRIRSKANLTGQIDHSDITNYSKLDAAFSHFDREQKGFLTSESFCSGLRALNYELAPDQLNTLMLQLCVFRHGGGSISRAEFDSFVLDPYGFRLLKRLSDQLYSELKPRIPDAIPRVAYLSRLLTKCGEASNQSHLPKNLFWPQLERALERQVTKLERLRLQHLFDVGRDGHIAFKLFLKVISQWRTPINVEESTLLRDSKVAEARQATISEERAETKLERTLEITTKSEKPVCSRDAILCSLHNQMSSIDFRSQAGIVEEYLRLKDRKHTGNIEMKQLKKIFGQIGLSLSADAFASLQVYFPGVDSSSAEEHVQLIAYEKLLQALTSINERNSDNQ